MTLILTLSLKVTIFIKVFKIFIGFCNNVLNIHFPRKRIIKHLQAFYKSKALYDIYQYNNFFCINKYYTNKYYVIYILIKEINNFHYLLQF